MIKRIIAFAILFCLIIAIPLSLAGITRVEIGAPFMSLLRTTSSELNDFKIAIPQIPSIPKLDKVGAFWTVLNVLVSFINGFVTMLNFIVTIFNYVIQVIQFLVILVKNMVTFRGTLNQSTDDFPYIS